jgi:dynein heavy chain
MTNIDDFKVMFDAVNAHEIPIPGEWDTKLHEFQKLIIIKAVRPDKCIAGV